MEFSEQYFLDLCKTKIEEKYHLGNGDERIKQRDFEYLIDLIASFSFIPHFQNFTNGVIDIRSVIYFITLIVLLLLINRQIIELKKAG